MCFGQGSRCFVCGNLALDSFGTTGIAAPSKNLARSRNPCSMSVCASSAILDEPEHSIVRGHVTAVKKTLPAVEAAL